MPGAKGGTGSQGKKSRGKSHIPCRRCGAKSYHCKKKECSACGYGNGPKLRTRHFGH